MVKQNVVYLNLLVTKLLVTNWPSCHCCRWTIFP